MDNLWKKLCQSYCLAPAQWSFEEGDATDGVYQHKTSILGLSFSPDESILALAGGGCIPGADSSIRLIDVATRKNIRTLCAHVCGVHDVCFDPQTGILASASFDYAVHLWSLDEKDVIFFRGEDDKTKGYSKFTQEGSLLAIGEYDYYEGPHSFYIYNLKTQKNVFELALPDEFGVTAMAISPDSAYLAVTAYSQNQTKPSRLYLVRLETFEVEQEHVFNEIGFYDLEFINGHKRLLAGISGGTFDEFESGLIEIKPCSGNIIWSELLGGIGVNIACHPCKPEVAVAFEGQEIRFYNSNDWKILRKYQLQEEDANVCSLAYSNTGNLLAYGLSNGKFNILNQSEKK